MATLGTFDPQLRHEVWFDEELLPEGWFDELLIDAPASGASITGSLSATFDAMTTASAGELPIAGQLPAGQFEAMTAVATATVSGGPVVGELLATFESMTVQAVGVLADLPPPDVPRAPGGRRRSRMVYPDQPEVIELLRPDEKTIAEPPVAAPDPSRPAESTLLERVGPARNRLVAAVAAEHALRPVESVLRFADAPDATAPGTDLAKAEAAAQDAIRNAKRRRQQGNAAALAAAQLLLSD